MGLHKIKQGLDLPISGEPRQEIEIGRPPVRVALVGPDYPGLKPRILTRTGDRVRRGQPLFEDKTTAGVRYASPGAGTVVAVHRGARRRFLSVVVELSESERSGQLEDDLEPFESYQGRPPASLDRTQIRALMVESGLWTALRTRPYGRVPDPETSPSSIFVSAIDTRPLAALPEVVVRGAEEELEIGLGALSRLSDGPTYLCKAPGSPLRAPARTSVQEEEFEGPHPAGNPGVHIYCLDPVSRSKTVWYIGYQDVLALGRLVTTGRYPITRVVSLAGPAVKKPRLVRTRLGASIEDLTGGELVPGENRVISGSVLCGRDAGSDELGYLGRYHLQVSALSEGRERELLGWVRPGLGKFSVIGAYLSSFLPRRRRAFTTTTNGSRRAMVPIGLYERVLPMDIEPTFLLRSLIVGDTERAEELGCLELEEEDVALCTFVCPGKIEYGPILRENLATIEKEG